MGIIAELVVADPSEANAVLGSDEPLGSWDGFAYKGLDRVRLITLWALVESGSPDNRFDERLDAVVVIRDPDEERWVEVIPLEMLTTLASVAALDDDDFNRLAQSWGQTDEFEGWENAEALDLLCQVSDLAERAQSVGKTLLLRVEP